MVKHNTIQKQCPYVKNDYWLCPDSLAKANDSWLNSGHPCKFSSHNLLDGSIQCSKIDTDSFSNASLYSPMDNNINIALNAK